MNTELLAPAGSFEAMTAAYLAGADAVYIGGEKFGARAYADNLTSEQMLAAIDYAHLRGKKLYLTVNTMLKEEEVSGELYDYLAPMYEQGLDAVIVQDYGVFSFIKRQFPGLALHCSTQMTITGPAGAAMLEELGAARIVTARELSLTELRRIRSRTGLEIESFVHGALCYCYSGQCLFSSMLGGRSGNRGKCAQPCRLPYRVWEGNHLLNHEKKAYVLSPKDMCTVDLLPDILEAGVTSLKIEGRMKKPEYTAGVVRIYRKYLDLALAGKQVLVSREDHRELFDLYNRDGFHQGYYYQRNGSSMMAMKNEKQQKKGKSMRNETLFSRIHETYVAPRDEVGLEAELSLKAGQPASLVLCGAGKTVHVQGALVQPALKQPLEPERVKQQLKKTGNTPFVMERIALQMEELAFLPLQELNHLRRTGLEALQKEILAKYVRQSCRRIEIGTSDADPRMVPPANLTLYCAVESAEQLETVLNAGYASRIYASWSIFKSGRYTGGMQAYIEQCTRSKTEPYLMLPQMLRCKNGESVKAELLQFKELGISGFLAKHPEEYALLREAGLAHCTVLDASLSPWNREGRRLFAELGMEGDTVPLELNEGEVKKRGAEGSEIILYGYTVLMVSAQCLKKNLDACKKENSRLLLQDRYKKQFCVKCDCNFCYNTIYNSIPYGLTEEYQRILKLGVRAARLNFTIEHKKETLSILELFSGICNGRKQPRTAGAFTRGHFRRGV